MAVEKSPADKGAFEKKEPVAETPQAASPVDEEKVRLAEELKQARAALGEVGEMVKSGRLKLVEEQAQQHAAEPEDDSALVDRKELKRFADDIKRTVAGVVVETTAQSARQIRASQTEHLRGKLKNFDKYEKEINALLDKVDPRLAADPATIQQVYRVVRANHIDEEVAEEVNARVPAQSAEDEDVWGEPEEEVEPEPEAAAPSGRARSAEPVARPRGGVAPSGDASASRPVLRSRTERAQPLSRDERRIAEAFGFTSAEEYRRYGDMNWKPDLMGSKGRTRF